MGKKIGQIDTVVDTSFLLLRSNTDSDRLTCIQDSNLICCEKEISGHVGIYQTPLIQQR